MAGSIKGIIVEIGGDTSGLQKALSKVNSTTSSLSRELRGINSLLKLDPKNTELLSQKQNVLNNSISTTQEKLKELQEIKELADIKMANGTKISEENYRALQREIINTQNKLKTLKLEASNWTQVGRKIEQVGTKIESIGNKVDSLGNKLTTRVTAPLVALGVVGVKSAMEQESAMQQVENIYGKASDTIKDFAENTAISYNMSTKEAYKYSQVYGNLIQSITDDQTENAESTQKLLKASSVIASSTGRTMEDVMDRIRSGLLGNTEAIEDLGVNVNVALLETTDAFKKIAGDTSWSKLSFQEQQQIRLLGILEQTSKKYGDEVNKNTSSSVQKLTAKFNNMTSKLNKNLLPVANKLIDKADKFLDKLDDLNDKEAENIINIGLMVAAAGPLVKILGTTTKTLGTGVKAVGTFSQAIGVMRSGMESSNVSANTLAKTLSALKSPAGLATAGVIALTSALIYFVTKETEAQKKARELSEEMLNSKKAMEEYNQNIDKTTNSNLSHIATTRKLKDELIALVDENGKVKEGYESRVSFILNELNNALGTEYKLNGNIIKSYQNLQGEIDTLIEKKRAEILLSADEEKYRNAIENQAQAVEDFKKVYDELGMSLDEAREKYSQLLIEYKKQQQDRDLISAIQTGKEMKSLRDLMTAYQDAEYKVKEYTDNKKQYEENYALFMEGKYNEISNTVQGSTQDWCTSSLESIKNSITEQSIALEAYKQLYKETGEEVAKQNLEQSQKNLESLAEELTARTNTINTLSEDEIEAWKTLANSSYDVYNEAISKMSPEMQSKIEEITGVVSRDTTIQGSIFKLTQDIDKTFKDNVDGNEWGNDLTKEISSGMTSQQSKNKITSASKSVAGWISSFLHFTVPEKGPLSDMDESMPDMIDLMVKGINDNKLKLINSVKKMASDMNSIINIGGIKDFGELQGNLSKEIANSTKTINNANKITLQIYPQKLTDAELDRTFNYIDRRYGNYMS